MEKNYILCHIYNLRITDEIMNRRGGSYFQVFHINDEYYFKKDPIEYIHDKKINYPIVKLVWIG